jgi:hypothetical protein
LGGEWNGTLDANGYYYGYGTKDCSFRTLSYLSGKPAIDIADYNSDLRRQEYAQAGKIEAELWSDQEWDNFATKEGASVQNV